jgi:YidC/Oxa1 family membrane protein insertase
VSTEKRAILAAVLMAVVFIAGQYLMPAPEAPAPQSPAPSTPAESTAKTANVPETAKAPKPEAAAPVAPPPRAGAAGPRPPQRIVMVETPLYRAAISSEGGKLQGFTLKYRGEKPMVVVGDLGPSGLVVGPPGHTEPLPMEIAGGDLQLGRDRPTGELVLTGQVDGLRVRETLTFRADSYAIETAVRIENPTATPRAVTASLPWSTRQAWRETPEKFLGQHPTEIVSARDGRVERLHGLCEMPEIASEGRFIAIDSIFYLAALVPRSGGFRLVAHGEPKEVCETKGKDPVGRVTIAVQATPTVAPKEARSPRKRPGKAGFSSMRGRRNTTGSAPTVSMTRSTLVAS